MILQGLAISIDRLSAVLEREAAPRATSSSGKVYGVEARRRRLQQTVDGVVLATTRNKHGRCSCEDRGLHAGMQIVELLRMQGCQIQYACPRLDAVRRHYGV